MTRKIDISIGINAEKTYRSTNGTIVGRLALDGEGDAIGSERFNLKVG